MALTVTTVSSATSPISGSDWRVSGRTDAERLSGRETGRDDGER
ncbi:MULTISPECIES: hypothetical protein [unclassified Modicisalibacter]|nr:MULTISPECIES: hypothetical protein [unclassified Modicisalibacter]